LTFIPNEKFNNLILKLVSSSEAYFGKAITILKKLLSVSKYAKALEHKSLQETLKGFPEKDMTFLITLIQYLASMRQLFITESNKQFNEDDDETKPFARKFCDLITVLCSNFELLLIQENEVSNQLFTLLKDCARAQN
jgi:hypothetical protein